VDKVRGWAVDLNRKIRDFEDGFRELYLDVIPLLYRKTHTGKGTGHYLSFSTVFSGVECLASMLSGKQAVRNETGNRFKIFVRQYFGGKYATHADDLWLLRCSLAHTFSCGGKFALTNDSPGHHFMPTTHGKICLNAQTLHKDFGKAADRYFDDVRTKKNVRRTFDLSIQQTGVINRSVQLPPIQVPMPKGVTVQLSEHTGTNVSHIQRL
jgi:hypothetical protein